jgi:hypothetical protein
VRAGVALRAGAGSGLPMMSHPCWIGLAYGFLKFLLR